MRAVSQICLGKADGVLRVKNGEVMESLKVLANLLVYNYDQKVFTAGGAMLATASYHASYSRLIESNDNICRLTGDRSVVKL